MIKGIKRYNKCFEVMNMESSESTILLNSIKDKSYMLIKDIFDILISFIGIIFTILVAIIVKISYMLSGDFHSIFFIQKRIGKNGKPFKLYKFRTMIPNADKELKELLKKEPYKTQWKKNQKLDKDPRITKLGKILRKTSLDELPQFINIYIGDMSLIGPRPLVEGELDSHNGNHEIYESVRPGITGWWACNGRSNMDYEERLELEYYYVNNRSILLDLKCILKTIEVVFFGKGAK